MIFQATYHGYVTIGIEDEKRLYSLPMDNRCTLSLYQGSTDKLLLESELFETPIILKSKFNEEISEHSWVTAVNNRALYHLAVNDENDAIINAESIISDHEIKLSEFEVKSLSNFHNVHGMLVNRRLRGAVKGALYKHQRDDLLRFWEIAEDYWQSYPSRDTVSIKSRANMIVEKYILPNTVALKHTYEDETSVSKALQDVWTNHHGHLSVRSVIDNRKNDQDRDNVIHDVVYTREYFDGYQTLVSSQIGRICLDLFFNDPMNIGKRYLQLALLPLDKV